MEVNGQLQRTDRFTLGIRASSTHWIGDWIGPRTGLDAVAKREKNPNIAPSKN